MEPKYSREQEITVATFPNEGRGVGLAVGVLGGRVFVSTDMNWECSPSAVDDVCVAIRSAALLAAQWTERDQRIADLMRLRAENSQLWYKAIHDAVAPFEGAFGTTSAQRSLLGAVQNARTRLVVQFGEAEIPEFSVRYGDTGVVIEPLWDRMPLFRWMGS
jgi:hypothetical protein